jgi:signal transduction histidine kinase
VALDELDAGQMDAKWIETSGIVRVVEPKAPSDSGPPPPGTRYTAPSASAAANGTGKMKLKLASGSARVVVEVSDPIDPADYVDAEVRLQGLSFNLHNHNRQFVGPFVQVPSGVKVVVVRRPRAESFDGPPSPVGNLLRFEQLNDQQGHRVHVRGVVLHHQPGTALWIRDHDHSLRVETTQAGHLQPGDEVDVLGFPALGDYSAVLEDAVYRKRVTPPQVPAPHALVDLGSALRNDANLVCLDATVEETRRFTDSVMLTLEWSGLTVRAHLHLGEAVVPPERWQPGTVVRVAGICSVETGANRPLGGLWEPRSFQLLLRSPEDVAVIQPPPWWSAERVVWVLSAFLAVAVTAVAVVMLASRRRLKEQEHRRAMAETEFAAILSERNRVAREIHDTLSQSLGAISVQLELARTHAGEISAAARHHLAAAHQLARGALTEARESIWNMRSQILERCDLGEALDEILHRLTEGTAVAPRMRVEGARRRLPPVVENNLLRIGQEAITNASKHARPTRIEVLLAFGPRDVRLSVEDDGAGFDPTPPPPGDHRSFGLVGIRERVELLGGTVEHVSAPGQGTRIAVTVPA